MAIFVNTTGDLGTRFLFTIGDNDFSRVLTREEVITLIEDLTEELKFYDLEMCFRKVSD